MASIVLVFFCFVFFLFQAFFSQMLINSYINHCEGLSSINAFTHSQMYISYIHIIFKNKSIDLFIKACVISTYATGYRKLEKRMSFQYL